MATVTAISPSEANAVRKGSIPDVVLETFNRLIVKNLSIGGRATVYQKDVVAALTAAGLSRDQIFENHWLDVEDSYRDAGWKVAYDKPGYCEDYDAYFVFSKQ